jgi:hypothetical protein
VSTQLDPNGDSVRVSDDVVLVTPGLRGTVSALPPRRPGTRGIPVPGDPLTDALAGQQVEIQQVVEIEDAQETPGPGATRGLGARHGEDAIELQVRPPQEGWEQFVVSQDESGIVTWHFSTGVSPESGDAPGAITRGGVGPATRTYRIPRRVVPAPRDDRSRGILTTLGKKVLRVVAFKAVGLLIQKGASAWMGKWEEKHRPYALRTLTPQNYLEPEGQAPDWKAISGKRALLFVHGTHTRSHVEFTHAPLDFVKQLYEAYEGRIVALDHPTVSIDPNHNVEWLLDEIPHDVELDLDVLCVSRGGLVARRLAAEQGGSREIHVGKIVFVASPNAGTPLADPERLNDFIDSYTNLFTMLPDTPVTFVLESIVGIAKLIAVNALKGLKGVDAMVPGGDFLRGLAEVGASPDQQFALASDYEPVEPGLKAFVRDALIDAFQKEANDLMVPTTGVYEGSGSPPFPIATKHRLVFDRGNGVTHSGYMRNRDARAAIGHWLGS